MATLAIEHTDVSANDERVLNRINLKPGLTGVGNLDGDLVTALVIDVETTGLDHENDAVIELAMRRFRYDEDGVIVEIGQCWNWREDPGVPLPKQITRLTGITDADLVGEKIDDDMVSRIVDGVDLLIAHNASFDRPMLEKRLPGTRYETPHFVRRCLFGEQFRLMI